MKFLADVTNSLIEMLGNVFAAFYYIGLSIALYVTGFLAVWNVFGGGTHPGFWFGSFILVCVLLFGKKRRR